MKVVIVEDEILAANHLEEILLKQQPKVTVVKILHSVKEAIEFLKNNANVDLIFCDIQLGDGHCFEIFQQTMLNIPVIFCTTYNQYALEAFKSNGIDYILKPFTDKAIEESIEKYQNFKQRFSSSQKDYSGILEILTSKNNHAKISSLLINFKGKIIPVKFEDVAVFTIENKITRLATFNDQKYFTNHTLDELQTLCGSDFYRANRQVLINRKAIAEVLQFFGRKLLLKLKAEHNDEIIISKNKVPDFLDWLSH